MRLGEFEKVFYASSVEICNHSGSVEIFRGSAEEAQRIFREYADYEVLIVEPFAPCGVLIYLAI